MLTSERIEECMLGCISISLKREEGIYRPFVGALILDTNEKLVGVGTKRFIPGTKALYTHAERNALRDAGEKARGGTLVTTLEPCIRIPRAAQVLAPCSELIAESGIHHVIIGRIDHRSDIDGKGIAYLQKQGIQVDIYEGYLEAQLERLIYDHRPR